MQSKEALKTKSNAAGQRHNSISRRVLPMIPPRFDALTAPLSTTARRVANLMRFVYSQHRRTRDALVRWVKDHHIRQEIDMRQVCNADKVADLTRHETASARLLLRALAQEFNRPRCPATTERSVSPFDWSRRLKAISRR